MTNSRRTLLFFHESAELYGSDRTLLQLAEGLDARRWRCVVALPREGPLAVALRAAGAEVEVGPVGTFGRATLRPRGLWHAARAFPESVAFARALVRRHQPVLVHSNTIVVLSGALAARAEGVPHLWHVHEIFERPRWIARALARTVARLSTLVVCNSRATAEHLTHLAPDAAPHARVVANGCAGFAPSAVNADRESARRALGVPLDAAVVALAGRVNAIKGQALLLGACARLRARHPALHVVLAGDAPPGQGHFEATLDAAIVEHGLAAHVTRIPFRSDVDVVFAAADVVAVPSLAPESFGLVAVEAMSLARPVVAARHGGLAEIVVDGETGLLFTPRDELDLARALGELLDDPVRARRFGVAGQARQRTRFSVERYVREFDALYAELADRAHVAHEAAA